MIDENKKSPYKEAFVLMPIYYFDMFFLFAALSLTCFPEFFKYLSNLQGLFVFVLCSSIIILPLSAMFSYLTGYVFDNYEPDKIIKYNAAFLSIYGVLFFMCLYAYNHYVLAFFPVYLIFLVLYTVYAWFKCNTYNEAVQVTYLKHAIFTVLNLLAIIICLYYHVKFTGSDIII